MSCKTTLILNAGTGYAIHSWGYLVFGYAVFVFDDWRVCNAVRGQLFCSGTQHYGCDHFIK